MGVDAERILDITVSGRRKRAASGKRLLQKNLG